MTKAEIIVTVIVGFGSGLVGAFAGAAAQVWHDRRPRREERLDQLWQCQRLLAQTGERLMNERGGDVAVDFREEEANVARHFRYMPRDLQLALDADEVAGTHTTFEIGDNLYGKGVALRRYLESEARPLLARLLRRA